MSQAILDHERELVVEDTAIAGPEIRSDGFALNGVQISGNFAGGWSVTIQGTIDGSVWFAISSAITVATLLDPSTTTLGVTWRNVRVLTNAAGTGVQPSVFLAGHKRNFG